MLFWCVQEEFGHGFHRWDIQGCQPGSRGCFRAGLRGQWNNIPWVVLSLGLEPGFPRALGSLPWARRSQELLAGIRGTICSIIPALCPLLGHFPAGLGHRDPVQVLFPDLSTPWEVLGFWINF